MKSWRTTIAGVAAFLSVAAPNASAIFDADPSTSANWNAIATAFGVMVALFFARDNGVTSEQAGAK